MAADAITHNNAEPGKTPEGNAVKFNLHRITSILALKLQGGAASEKIASVMLTSKKPIASEKLTFTVPSDPNAAYDPSAITPKLVAKDAPATGSPISINSGAHHRHLRRRHGSFGRLQRDLFQRAP